jgi:DNA-directed RNA polymerase subunit RPC12/RpoP
MENKTNYIICPKCGAEYLPAEIFYPDVVLGNPENIIKDKKGKIEFFIGESVNLTEEYTCYTCNCKFLVEGSVKFNTKESPKSKFDEDYKTVVYSNRSSLKEK